jgi:hypothetical protein
MPDVVGGQARAKCRCPIGQILFEKATLLGMAGAIHSESIHC